ncbi:MAG: sulfite exporter TauE/SafE family protein [Bacteroidetes bacterium]|nr:MAG: sulfite exporter TauE/SafE family protein [Bacteroidota bacterium]
MEIAGFICAFIIGFLLALLGGGGSILTVPVLVYVFNIEPTLATAYSLFVVCVSSLVGCCSYIKDKQANIKTALFFSFPSFLMVFLMRKYIVPAIPNEILSFNSFELTKNILIMTVFAILIIVASISMIKQQKKVTENIQSIQKRLHYPVIFLEGIVVGCLTGFVGVGGGFLIIPVLTLFVRMPMKMAVGTSLLIIFINSFFGFVGEITIQQMDWNFLLIFTSICCLGVLIGILASKKIDNVKLKPAFGWFLLILGMFILSKEFLF